MSRNFTLLSPAIWRSQRFRSLPNDDCRLLLLYYICGPHQTSAGAYAVPEGYACDDLQWSLEKYEETRSLLIEAGLIHFDQTTKEIVIVGWFEHCPPMNPKHADGTLKLVKQLRSQKLRNISLHALQTALEEKGMLPIIAPTGGSENDGDGDTGQDHYLTQTPHISRLTHRN